MWLVVGLIASIVLGIASLVGGTVGGYPLLRALGVSEREGKAGYYAFVFVGVPIGIAGAIVAFRSMAYVRHLF